MRSSVLQSVATPDVSCFFSFKRYWSFFGANDVTHVAVVVLTVGSLAQGLEASIPLFVELASRGLCFIEGSLLLPGQSSDSSVNPWVGMPRGGKFVWYLSIRLRWLTLSLKGVHMASTDGNVSDTNDMTKDIVPIFKNEMSALLHMEIFPFVGFTLRGLMRVSIKIAS
jgi:hypothetical protein